MKRICSKICISLANRHLKPQLRNYLPGDRKLTGILSPTPSDTSRRATVWYSNRNIGGLSIIVIISRIGYLPRIQPMGMWYFLCFKVIGAIEYFYLIRVYT